MIGPTLIAAAAAASAAAGSYVGELVHRDMSGPSEADWRVQSGLVAADLAVIEAHLRIAANTLDAEKQKAIVEQALRIAARSQETLAKAPAPQSELEDRLLKGARSALLAFLKTGREVAGAAAAGLGTALFVAAVGLGIGLALMKGK